MIEARKLLATSKEITILNLNRYYSEQFIEQLYYIGAPMIFLNKDKGIVIIADYASQKKVLLECIKVASSIEEISKNVFQCRTV
jgi:hypothetical protein